MSKQFLVLSDLMTNAMKNIRQACASSDIDEESLKDKKGKREGMRKVEGWWRGGCMSDRTDGVHKARRAKLDRE